MAKHVLKDAFIEVDGVDLSNNASQVVIDTPDDEVELSGFGSGFKERGKGLSDATITVTFLQDYAVGKVDDTLWPLKQSDTPFPLVIRPFSGPVASTNPEFEIQALLFNYSPLSGALGEANSTEVSFRNADQAGLTRATS